MNHWWPVAELQSNAEPFPKWDNSGGFMISRLQPQQYISKALRLKQQTWDHKSIYGREGTFPCPRSATRDQIQIGTACKPMYYSSSLFYALRIHDCIKKERYRLIITQSTPSGVKRWPLWRIWHGSLHRERLMISRRPRAPTALF